MNRVQRRACRRKHSNLTERNAVGTMSWRALKETHSYGGNTSSQNTKDAQSNSTRNDTWDKTEQSVRLCESLRAATLLVPKSRVELGEVFLHLPSSIHFRATIFVR